jgi:hypothetical protein
VLDSCRRRSFQPARLFFSTKNRCLRASLFGIYLRRRGSLSKAAPSLLIKVTVDRWLAAAATALSYSLSSPWKAAAATAPACSGRRRPARLPRLTVGIGPSSSDLAGCRPNRLDFGSGVLDFDCLSAFLVLEFLLELVSGSEQVDWIVR